MALFPQLFLTSDEVSSWNKLVLGARMTLISVFIGLVIAGLIPVAIGVVSGYYKSLRVLHGFLDWIYDILEMFPIILIAITADFILQKQYTLVMCVISFFLIPRFSRVIQSKTSSIRDREFIQIALMNGIKDIAIIRTHIMPLLKDTIVSNLAGCIASIVLLLTGIGFLELALLPGMNNWGYIVRCNIPSSISDFLEPNFMLPLTFIVTTVFSFFWTSEYFKEKRDLIQE